MAAMPIVDDSTVVRFRKIAAIEAYEIMVNAYLLSCVISCVTFIKMDLLSTFGRPFSIEVIWF